MKVTIKLFFLLIVLITFASLEELAGYSLISIDKAGLSPKTYQKLTSLSFQTERNFIFLSDSKTEIFGLQNDNGSFIKQFCGEEVQFKIIEKNYDKIVDLEKSLIRKRNEDV